MVCWYSNFLIEEALSRLVEKHVAEVEKLEIKWDKDIQDLKALQKKEFRNFVREYSFTLEDGKYVFLSSCDRLFVYWTTPRADDDEGASPDISSRESPSIKRLSFFPSLLRKKQAEPEILRWGPCSHFSLYFLTTTE